MRNPDRVFIFFLALRNFARRRVAPVLSRYPADTVRFYRGGVCSGDEVQGAEKLSSGGEPGFVRENLGREGRF